MTHFHDGHKKEHDHKYDAICCLDCDEWLEIKCMDEENCTFCNGRPEKPSRRASLKAAGKEEG